MSMLTSPGPVVIHARHSFSRLSRERSFVPVTWVVALALASLKLSATAHAVNPPPDGGYPNRNTAEGEDALLHVTTGYDNTALGFQALVSNTTGFQNTANSDSALRSNVSGFENTANGFAALFTNTSGDCNTANGFEALFWNTGSSNTASGSGALFSNTTGNANTATGLAALAANTTGHDNTANGVDALFLNTTGRANTADGSHALFNNTTGSNNVALGNNAGSLVTGSNNIDIGAQGAAGESGVIRIGMSSTATATFIAGISGKTVAAGVGVIINPKGELGTVQSSGRFKEAIKPMDKASEAILSLQPVTFHYKHDLDPDGIPQFGLVAEQVEKVNPDLVVRGEDGKVMTVRYEAVNAMLLNEFLKEHRQVEEQKAGLAEMKSVVSKQEELIAKQQKQIETLTATVRSVSDQIALSKPAPELVTNQ
jgi:uncharacterized coiled-coil protein SlyX